jgi:hypothetical protein
MIQQSDTTEGFTGIEFTPAPSNVPGEMSLKFRAPNGERIYTYRMSTDPAAVPTPLSIIDSRKPAPLLAGQHRFIGAVVIGTTTIATLGLLVLVMARALERTEAKHQRRMGLGSGV